MKLFHIHRAPLRPGVLGRVTWVIVSAIYHRKGGKLTTFGGLWGTAMCFPMETLSSSRRQEVVLSSVAGALCELFANAGVSGGLPMPVPCASDLLVPFSEEEK